MSALAIGCCGLALQAFGSVANAAVTLPGHLKPLIAGSQYVGQVAATQNVDLAIVLPLRNQQALSELLRRLYDPSDSLYGQYLTPTAFTEGYGPTQADYDAVKAYAASQGLTVTHEHSNRAILDVSGPASSVESAFGVTLRQYRTSDGRLYRAADSNPAVPNSLSGKVASVLGLDTSTLRSPQYQIKQPDEESSSASLKPLAYSGNAGFAPADYLSAYGLYSTISSLALTGSGQVIALFELGTGFSSSNITTYTTYYSTYFNLFKTTSQTAYVPPVTAVSVDSQSTTTLSLDAETEVELDIELALAMAPQAKILVYEAPNTDAGWLDELSEIATDTTNTGTSSVPNIMSMSWGSPEITTSTADLDAENIIFTEMAAQGQSAFIASGDQGAYTADNFTTAYNAKTLSVSDPASQPLVCAVGGTSLTTNGTGATTTWSSETTWNNGLKLVEAGTGGASGGGISAFWSIPAFQSTYIPASSMGSSSTATASNTMRNVPDVALNGDPVTGYDIYTAATATTNAWASVGGTSAATPLWAAFTALLNQKRVANGLAAIGEINPALYKFAASTRYSNDYHDITSGTNLNYSAATGYDLTTGWGSFLGLNLLNDLAPASTYRTFASGLEFFSIPYDYSSLTLANLFGYTSPRILIWDPVNSAWNVPSEISLGKGYWVRFPSSITITTIGIPGTATTTLSGDTTGTTYYAIPLQAGWNQIGNPFTTNVTIGDTIKVNALKSAWSSAVGSGTILGTLYYYDPSQDTTQYLTVTSSSASPYLIPGFGYWIYASADATLYLPSPSTTSTAVTTATSSTKSL